MGTWGITAFEDDTAMEFYDQFCFGDQSILELESVIDKVLITDYRMEGDLLFDGFTEPVKALVSVEIIAASLGKPIDQFPDEDYHNAEDPVPLPDLENIKKGINSSILDKARRCVEKIRNTENIHLRVLWEESGSFDEWKEYMTDLNQRLNF